MAPGFFGWGISSASSPSSSFLHPHLHFQSRPRSPRRSSSSSSSSSSSAKSVESLSSPKWRFSLKAASTSGALSLLGDSIAQIQSRWIQHHKKGNLLAEDGDVAAMPAKQEKALAEVIFNNHDWFRASRMATYGFLIYGPASQVWYEFLDRIFWQKSLTNLSIKVVLNQIVLGPFVIAAVFAWNNLLQGKLDALPNLYRNHAIPTLVAGWKFWVPASVINFGAVPLQTRVVFMSCCSIFWNFYLSATMCKS